MEGEGGCFPHRCLLVYCVLRCNTTPTSRTDLRAGPTASCLTESGTAAATHTATPEPCRGWLPLGGGTTRWRCLLALPAQMCVCLSSSMPMRRLCGLRDKAVRCLGVEGQVSDGVSLRLAGSGDMLGGDDTLLQHTQLEAGATVEVVLIPRQAFGPDEGVTFDDGAESRSWGTCCRSRHLHLRKIEHGTGPHLCQRGCA